MSKYELVALISSRLSNEEIDNTKKHIWKIVENEKGKVLDIDDIWNLKLEYEINKETNAYFYSICIDIEADSVIKFKNDLNLYKWILRWKMFKLWNKDQFLKFKDINETIVAEIDDENKWIFNEINS